MEYLVVGCGISGIAASRLLIEDDKKVILYDGNKDLDVNALVSNNPFLTKATIVTGELTDEYIERADVAILSPGVPTDLPFVEKLRESGCEISGEIELGFRYGKGKMIAITGTNGKTTTTSLVGQIVKRQFNNTFVVGNIGIPYTQVCKETTEDGVTVAEISSFQLETVSTFKPEVSAILNITPDHLNRHHTMEAYAEAKERIALSQGEDGVCVLNYEDDVLREFGKTLKQKVVFFSSKTPLKDGFFYEDGTIYKAENGKSRAYIDVEELNILGLHNYENAMAAIAMCEAIGVDEKEILEGLRTFVAVEHRIEYVCEKKGVKYYNDSKGTNTDAAIQAVKAMNRPTILIGGGYDKGSEYDEWIETFGDKVKMLVLIGQTAEAIAECARKHGFENIVFADSLEEVVDICYKNAKEGDAVLLSPACASWGMFKNYEERGDIFKSLVNNLEG